MSFRWPACRLPMVGAKPTRLPARRAAATSRRRSATVKTTFIKNKTVVLAGILGADAARHQRSKKRQQDQQAKFSVDELANAGDFSGRHRVRRLTLRGLAPLDETDRRVYGDEPD